MARYHGRSGALYMAVNGTGVAVKVASLTSWSLDQATDTSEVTSFGDANKTYVQGLPDLKGSFEGFWDDTDDTVFQAATSTDGSKMYLYPSTNALSKYWYGPSWVNASIDTKVNGPVAVKGGFVANGSWGRK